jgi:hypothetical protein
LEKKEAIYLRRIPIEEMMVEMDLGGGMVKMVKTVEMGMDRNMLDTAEKVERV